MPPRLVPERLTKCPLKPECVARVVYRDSETDEIYRLDMRSGEYVTHKCTTRGSELPLVAFAAQWLNRKTGRTRWQGPTRTRESVLKPPYDERFRERKANPDWEFVQLYQTDLDWEPIDGKPIEVEAPPEAKRSSRKR